MGNSYVTCGFCQHILIKKQLLIYEFVITGRTIKPQKPTRACDKSYQLDSNIYKKLYPDGIIAYTICWTGCRGNANNAKQSVLIMYKCVVLEWP